MTMAGSWSLAATAPWSGRHMHGAVVHDDHIWIVGAESGTPDDVWKSKDGVSWELVASTVPWQDRGNQMVTVFDGSIWVMGGQASVPAQTNFVADLKAGKPFPPAPPPLRDVWRTRDGLSWELVTDSAPWAPRGMITGANGGVPVLDDRMWILGGGICRDGRDHAELTAIRPGAAAKIEGAPVPQRRVVVGRRPRMDPSPGGGRSALAGTVLSRYRGVGRQALGVGRAPGSGGPPIGGLDRRQSQ